jgi:hypothetical protein
MESTVAVARSTPGTYTLKAFGRILQKGSTGPVAVGTGIPSPSGPRTFGGPWCSKSLGSLANRRSKQSWGLVARGCAAFSPSCDGVAGRRASCVVGGNHSHKVNTGHPAVSGMNRPTFNLRGPDPLKLSPENPRLMCARAIRLRPPATRSFSKKRSSAAVDSQLQLANEDFPSS